LHVRDWCGATGDPHTLSVLVDFLVGESIQTLARKYGVSEERVESGLRSALAHYDFSATRRTAPPVVRQIHATVNGDPQCS